MEDMFITPIQPWDRIGGSGSTIDTSSSVVKGQEGISAFKGIFEDAINNVRETEDDLAKNQYLLATGQLENPHTVGIAASKAQLPLICLWHCGRKPWKPTMKLCVSAHEKGHLLRGCLFAVSGSKDSAVGCMLGENK